MKSKTYYHRQTWEKPKTLTVGELIAELKKLPPDMPVIYRMPEHGCFGAGSQNAIDTVKLEKYKRERIHHKAHSYICEETGKKIKVSGHYDIRHAWEGVVIQ